MKKILIIEDTQYVAEEVNDILEMEGFTVLQAQNGAQGLQIAITQKPDLIISDIKMPKMDGFQMLKELKARKDTENIPVVFLSAKADKETIEKSKTLKVASFLAKPISPNNFIATINNTINNTKKNKRQKGIKKSKIC